MEDLLAQVLVVVLVGLDVGHLAQAGLLGRVRAPALGVVGAPVGGARRGVLLALGGALLGDLLGRALAGLGLAGARGGVGVLALGLLVGGLVAGGLGLHLGLARRRGVGGRADQLLHHRGHEGRQLELLVVVGAAAAGGGSSGSAPSGGAPGGGAWSASGRSDRPGSARPSSIRR